ncbi:MAG: aminotransferase class I/II-fold pyridoxal phosphate-dependent enzyme [Marinilabiliaceae bacterium]|nr:aminotransferase class I/II-fold pyridoxal phosphate-dependent enzyme [Marinilabiliaceae bacterium]
MNIQPAQRISRVEEYYFSRKLKEIDLLRSQGKAVINLGIGNPDLPPAPEVLDELANAAAHPGHHGYQSYVGIPELRKAFADWYRTYFNVTLNPVNEILPMMGSKEAIMHISMAFLNPGDEVLLPDPGYPTYLSVCNLVGATPRTYLLDPARNYEPDLEALAKQDLSKVKLMWVNYPNMPTGATGSRALLEKLVAFGKAHNILICNDNPYSFILNQNYQSILSVEGAKECCIELNSLSKSHNMSGWRIGMMASNAEFVQYVLRVKSNMDSGMFRPLQMAAVKALSLPPSWYDEVNRNYRERREIVFEMMDLLGCTYDPKQVGMFVWGAIPADVESSRALSDKVLYEADVFITPGYIFGERWDTHIRISLCTKVPDLQEAKARIQKLLGK